MILLEEKKQTKLLLLEDAKKAVREKEKEIAGYREKLEAAKAEVIMAILSLDNPDWQKALQYRFLDDMSNQDAANKMNVDIRTVQRYVEWGCFALKLPDRFYKKPPAA